MPFEIPTRLATATKVEPSAAVELSWLLFACGRHERALHLPADVIVQVDDFWQDGLGIQPEALVVADLLGCLTGWTIEPLLDLEHRAFGPVPALRLATESAEVSHAVTRRLTQLAASPAVRRRYGELLRLVWSYGRPVLEHSGRAAVDRTVLRIRASLDHGTSPLDLVPARHIARSDEYLPLTTRALAGGSALISPSYFAGTLGHVVDLPGAYSIAVGTGVSPDAAAERGAAERVASGLKLLADPTRLLILTQLRQRPAAVGQIAKQVGVAQPTASVHVRQLREAGLLTQVRDGGITLYRTDGDRVDALLTQAHQALRERPGPAGR
jgi:ArsR family transcriptional regulator, nickel/cobalt-responsive transcriptional repressor